MASPSSTCKPERHAQQETVAQESAREAFTPGPWKATTDKSWRFHSCCYDFAITGYRDGSKTTIAETANAANAALIAAAPDMLAALQKIEQQLDYGQIDRTIQIARAAISKALSIQPPSSVAHGAVTSEPMKVKP